MVIGTLWSLTGGEDGGIRNVPPFNATLAAVVSGLGESGEGRKGRACILFSPAVRPLGEEVSFTIHQLRAKFFGYIILGNFTTLVCVSPFYRGGN